MLEAVEISATLFVLFALLGLPPSCGSSGLLWLRGRAHMDGVSDLV